jgi:hypothetical protein
MRSWILLALSLFLVACGQKAEEAPAGPDPLTVPASADKKAWATFMNAVIRETKFKDGAKGIYPYFIDPAEDNERKLEVIGDSVRNGMQPGYAFVITSSDSAKAADFIVTAFAEAKPDTLRQTKMLFIGKKSDEARVRAAVEPSGMAVIFHGTD